MTIEKNTTAEEISKIHATLLHNYVNSNSVIENVSTIKKDINEYIRVKVNDYSIMTKTLDTWTQIEMLVIMEEIMASSYLSAVAELIVKKQEHGTRQK